MLSENSVYKENVSQIFQMAKKKNGIDLKKLL